MTHRATLKHQERLKSQKQIEKLFASARSKFKYPIKLLYRVEPQSQQYPSLQFSVSVPKKKIKSAVNRNRIKRLVREAYRTNKHRLKDQIEFHSKYQLSLMFIFIENELVELPVIEKSIIHLIKQLEYEIAK